MKLSKFLIFIPVFLMALTETSASKSITEINIRPPSSKLLAKLMGMSKPKHKTKSKLQRKSARLPKMGFLNSNSLHSLMEDQLLSTNPRQDYMGLMGNSMKLSSFDNSPIYYVRLPPTPYMYTPGLGYVSQPSSSVASSIASSMHSDSFRGNNMNPFMNLPINFLSNGQPNGAYEFSMPELMSSAFPGKGFLRQEPPIFGRKQFFEDPKFSTLKGRFDFNGRPDGVYVLPDNSFYQSNMFN